MVWQFRKNACNETSSISKEFVLNLMKNNDFIQNLNINSWSILGFNYTTREVCIKIEDSIGSRVITVTPPKLPFEKNE